tara:strand:+ start:324 stop:806 length:483 start_codon:yes stop_codon:yes gene_type:complete
MSKRILAIDPGNEISGWVIVDEGGSIYSADNTLNEKILMDIKMLGHHVDVVAIEWISSYGMAVGKTVFETCLWIGRFVEAAKMHDVELRIIPRIACKLHHCGKGTAKDSNVTQAIKDKYGEKGTKANPGYFYGVSKHAWQAFAIAAYVMEGGEHKSELKL